jgi:hypothetical protein
LPRLKAAIDQAKEGRGATRDLPSGHDVTVRVKDVKKLAGNPMFNANASSDDLVGLTGTLTWADKLALNLQLDMKDAQTATNTEQQIKSTLQLLSQFSQPGAANGSATGSAGGNPLSALSVSTSGAQLRISGAVPSSQLGSMIPSNTGPPPGSLGPTPTPGRMHSNGGPSGFPAPTGSMFPPGTPGASPASQ